LDFTRSQPERVFFLPVPLQAGRPQVLENLPVGRQRQRARVGQVLDEKAAMEWMLIYLRRFTASVA